MGALTPTELLTLWKQEQVTVEMSIGHMVQNLVKQQTTIDALTSALGKMRADLDRLSAPTDKPKPDTKGKKLDPSH